jgi:hypothetical protein
VTSVTFQWEENLDNGGSEVTDFWVYCDEGNNVLAEESFVEADDTTYMTQMHQENSLTKGNWYRFYVISVNDAGLSEPSDTFTLLAATVNTEPTDLHTTFQDENVISLAWTEPTTNVGSLA